MNYHSVLLLSSLIRNTQHFPVPSQVLDILQHIQALDPSQHGAVGYLVQHTLEHIQHKKHPVAPEVKRRSSPEHLEVQYSVGLIMKHKRWVILAWSTANLLYDTS